MIAKDLIEELQNRAEGIVIEQLSEVWRYRLLAVENKKTGSPDMIVVKRNGEHLYLCIQGVDTNTNITSKEADWKESCREFAQQEGITLNFLEVVILDRKGKGNDIFIKGLMELGKELRSPKEMIGPTNNLVWIADSTLNDLKQATYPSSEQKKFYEEMEAVDKLEGERIRDDLLRRSKGKPIDKIPDGDYCYTSNIPADKADQYRECERIHGPESGESFVLWVELHVVTNCPYREWTDYGTVKCHFLEKEAIGLSDEDYEKALAHFGSEEKLEEECQGGDILADAVKCCRLVVERIKQAT